MNECMVVGGEYVKYASAVACLRLFRAPRLRPTVAFALPAPCIPAPHATVRSFGRPRRRSSAHAIAFAALVPVLVRAAAAVFYSTLARLVAAAAL